MKYNKILKTTLVAAFILFSSNISFGAIATDAKLQYNKGIDYYQLGQYEQASYCFKSAIELDPNYIDAYYNLGSILEYLKQDEEALAVFKQIILRKPDDYEAVYKAAFLSKKLGEYKKAKMYLSLIPTDTLIGQQATQLAKSMPDESETTPAETTTSKQPVEQTENPMKQLISSNKTTYEDIASPTGIVSDNNGNLYVAGFSDNTIYKINPENQKIVYIKNEKIDGPIGIAMDSDENLYIANYNKNNVLKVGKGGEISELITDIQKPYYIYIKNDLLFVSSQGSNSVVRFKL